MGKTALQTQMLAKLRNVTVYPALKLNMIFCCFVPVITLYGDKLVNPVEILTALVRRYLYMSLTLYPCSLVGQRL